MAEDDINWDAISRALNAIDPVFKSDNFATTIPYVANTVRKLRETDNPKASSVYKLIRRGVTSTGGGWGLWY